MYLLTVALLTFILPVGSILLDHFLWATALSWIALIGKWFVFWSAGIRLLLAGLRQFYQPEFTARDIFRLESKDALPIIRELGIANAAIGVVGALSLAQPSFVLPIAISGALFYGVAGARHASDAERSFNQTVAMASDLFVCLALLTYLGGSLFY
jgi:hypothetical protein